MENGLTNLEDGEEGGLGEGWCGQSPPKDQATFSRFWLSDFLR